MIATRCTALCVVLALAAAAAALPAAAATQAPLDSTQQDHWLMSTFEYSKYAPYPWMLPVQKIHGGFDFPTIPAGLPGASTVVATVDTCIDTGMSTGPGDSNEEASIYSTTFSDGAVHLYQHLVRSSLSLLYPLPASDCVNAGDPLGRVRKLDSGFVGCDPSHLHYEIISGGQKVAPVAYLAPFVDKTAPWISEVLLCEDDAPKNLTDAWEHCVPYTPGELCLQISGGRRDLLVHLADRHAPLAPPLPVDDAINVRRLRYRICPNSDPSCPLVTSFDFATLDAGLADTGGAEVGVLFSTRAGAKSVSHYCTGDDFWIVATNATDNVLDPAGHWDASGSGGFHTLTVQADDYADNPALYSVPLCVGTAFPDPVIRDCREDVGMAPSTCPTCSASPDIVARRLSPGPPTGLRAGEIVEFEVCMTNAGTATVPPTAQIDVAVSIGYRAPGTPLASGSFLVSELFERGTTTPPVRRWTRGGERCARLTWQTDVAIDPTSVPADLKILANLALVPETLVVDPVAPCTDPNVAAKSIGLVFNDLGVTVPPDYGSRPPG